MAMGVAGEPPRGWFGPDTLYGLADPPAGSLLSLLDLVMLQIWYCGGWALQEWRRWVGVYGSGVVALGGFSSILVAAHFS
jgi:hypothetical protein